MRVLRINRLATKIAALVAACVLPLLPLLALTTRAASGWLVAGVSLGLAVGIGAATYVAVHRLLVQRLELARTTLRQVRKHNFENLEAARIPKGDELNDLIWQVYRTGLTLQREIDRLKQVESYRREFLGDVSHELKTPIFAIQGFTETLLDGALDDPAVNRPFLEKILTNADRLNTLARDLSEISKIETGQLKMRVEAFDLGGLVREVLDALELAAAQRNVTLFTHLPPGLPLVNADRERIRQVLTNLVDNAIKYNNPGGRIEVVARPIPGQRQIRISVVDDGIGIPPEAIPRLTERFYRVDKSRSREQGGTGLGLAIVKHILDAHGATLHVESEPGRGSKFRFLLEAV